MVQRHKQHFRGLLPNNHEKFTRESESGDTNNILRGLFVDHQSLQLVCDVLHDRLLITDCRYAKKEEIFS